MNVGVHGRSQRIIYHSMAREQPMAGKGSAHQSDGEVSATRLGAGVPRMFMAFVDDGEVLGCQRRGEAMADHLNARRWFNVRSWHYGNTCLNGFTLTLAYTPALQ